MVVTKVLAGIGALWVGSLALKAIDIIRLYTRPSKLSRYLSDDKPSWALVTGANGGIGFGFAEELCARGFNVVIHGRNQGKLEQRVRELKERYPSREVEFVVGDSSLDGFSAIEAVVESVRDKNLKVLVNNISLAAVRQRTYKPIEDAVPNEIEDLFNINIRFFTHVTATLLPQLKRNAPGLILNVGSLGGKNTMAYIQIYASTKAYQTALSSALSIEMGLENSDVEILSLYIGSVQSQTNEVDTTFFIPTSRDAACASLDRVGCGKRVIIPYWPHFLQDSMASSLPEPFYTKIVQSILRDLKDVEDKKLKSR